MVTAREDIESALRKIGALTTGESASPEEATDALEVLNDLIASWSNDGLQIYSRSVENFSLTGGKSSYTIGSGGDFNTSRPISLASAYIRQGTTDHLLSFIDDVQYSSISQKSTTGTPLYLNYDYAYPLGNIKLYPNPSGGDTLYLVSEKELSSVASLNTEISFPPGWRRAFVLNLAVELAPEYGQPVTPELFESAKSALGNIRVAIARNRDMSYFPSNLGANNIYSGYYD